MKQLYAIYGLVLCAAGAVIGFIIHPFLDGIEGARVSANNWVRS